MLACEKLARTDSLVMCVIKASRVLQCSLNGSVMLLSVLCFCNVMLLLVFVFAVSCCCWCLFADLEHGPTPVDKAAGAQPIFPPQLHPHLLHPGGPEDSQGHLGHV